MAFVGGRSRGTSPSLDLTFPPTGLSENLGEWKGEGEGKGRVGETTCLTPPPLASASNSTLLLPALRQLREEDCSNSHDKLQNFQRLVQELSQFSEIQGQLSEAGLEFKAGTRTPTYTVPPLTPSTAETQALAYAPLCSVSKRQYTLCKKTTLSTTANIGVNDVHHWRQKYWIQREKQTYNLSQ